MAYDVGALRKSIALLRILAEAPQPLGLTELAQQAGVAKNMVYRACRTLIDHGWVAVEGEPPRYRLTLAPFQLFARPLERTQLTTAVHAPLQDLATRCGETAYCAVRDGDRAVHVQVIDGPGPIRVAGGIGSGFPLHATAQGKVLLAWDPDARATLPRRLARLTAATITTRAGLEAACAHIRTQGWAANREEFAAGLIGCAAPVLDRSGNCIAALGVFATTATVDEERLQQAIAPAVMAAAGTVSAALGAPGADPDVMGDVRI
ncbi:MAG: IclR family transcriptional regulator [Planctomycetota bacterium]